MKKIVTLTFLILSITLFAQSQQRPKGSLAIFSEDGAKFKLYLNGQLQNKMSKTKVMAENLTQKVYKVKIQFENPFLPTLYENKIVIGDYSTVGRVDFYDVIYKIKIYKNNAKLVYFDRQLAEQTFIIDPVVIDNGGVRPPYGTGVRPSVPKPRGCRGNREISSVDFRNIKIAIDNETFNSDKIALIKRIIAENCMSTLQISDILKTHFSFDSDRLEIAILAFDYCVDPKNYFQLNSLLTFNSSRNELNKYVDSKKIN